MRANTIKNTSEVTEAEKNKWYKLYTESGMSMTNIATRFNRTKWRIGDYISERLSLEGRPRNSRQSDLPTRKQLQGLKLPKSPFAPGQKV